MVVVLPSILLIPAFSGIMDAVLRRRFASIVGALLLLLGVSFAWHGSQYSLFLPLVLPELGITFGATPIPLLLVAVTGVVWLALSIFSLTYMEHEHNVSRFYVFMGLSVSGAIGCFLAQDFLALLISFEMMSLCSYGLVAHTQQECSRRAGRLYLYLGVIGGVLLSLGLALLWSRYGSLSFSALHGLPLGVCVLIGLGFAIKAGAFPVHFWLPEAHPVAPSPASALLSGILIKCGAFGLLQVASLTADGHQYGSALIVVALLTMVVGVSLALLQHDAKRLLAYHSVSQMGYILLGVGLWAMDKSALAYGGAVFHIVNHALFKSALFLICGSALLSLGTVDLYNLGSMRKVFGWLTPLALLPALGIAGIPGFNGYVSKTLLHDSLLHAHHPSTLIFVAEKVFMLVAFGTVCSFIKFSWYMFFADRSAGKVKTGVSLPESLALGLLGFSIVFMGVYPGPVLSTLAEHAHHLHAHWPEHLSLFNLHALETAGVVTIGGIVLFFVGLRLGLFHLHVPFSILGAAGVVAALWKRVDQVAAEALRRGNDTLDHFGTEAMTLFKRSLQALDYRPSSSPNLRTLSVTNLNFDVYVVMAVLSILVVIYPLFIR